MIDKCHPPKHLKARLVETVSGEDRHGKSWSEEHWICDACGIKWTVASGSGVDGKS